MKAYFVTGIGTGIGKTVVSAILSEAFEATYWKPIQAGSPTDSEFVKRFTSCKVLAETYLLKAAISPHAAAAREGINITLDKFALPECSTEHLFVEGVGGLLSPINNNCTNIDLIKKLNLPVIVVASNYLGSINHSLMTLEVLKASKIEIKGLIISGEPNQESESFVQEHSAIKLLAHIPKLIVINRSSVSQAAAEVKKLLSL